MSALDGQDLLKLTKHIVGRMTLTPDDASEAISVGVVAAVEGYQKWESLSPSQAASTYVTNQVRWAILTHFRKEKAHQRRIERMIEDLPSLQWFAYSSTKYVDYSDINAALGRLESKERDVLSAVAFGFSMPEICRRFRVNPAAIQTARKHFAALVAEEA